MTSYLRTRHQKSPAHQTLFAVQRGCEPQIQTVLQMLAAADQPSQGHAAQSAREEQFLMAIQAKNDCYARNVCPSQHQEALQCVLEPERVAGGKCDKVLSAVSQCVKDFWSRTLNERVVALMQGQAACPDQCSALLEKQQSCVAKWGSEAPLKCAQEVRAVQVCLGACLDKAVGARLAACRAAGGSCVEEEQAAEEARRGAGRNVLLAMGFSDSDLAGGENSDQLLNMAGMVVSMGQIENQLAAQQQQ